MPATLPLSDTPEAVSRKDVGHVLLALIFYFAAGRLGLLAPFTSGNVSPIWPAAGVALALMLRWGVRIWPGIALGAFLVNVLTPLPTWAALGPAAGNTLSAVAGAMLLRRFADFDLRLTKLRDVLLLVVVGAGLSTMIAATVGAATFFAAGARPWSDFPSAWVIWWLGDATGVLIAAPLFLNAGALTRKALRSKELLILAAGTLAACLVIFDDRVLRQVSQQPMAYMVFPFVIWAAIRFGLLGAAAVNLVIATAAVAATAVYSGPFTTPVPFYNAILLQMFISLLAVTGLILSAVVLERERAEAALKSERRLLQEREAAEHGLRAAEASLRRNHERIELAQAAARLGYWEWDIVTGEITWSENIPSLHGLAPGALQPDFEEWWALIHAEDRPRLQQALEEALAGTRQYDVEFRTPWSDGSLHWIAAQAHVVRDGGGAPQRMVGTAMDITRRKQAELALIRSEKLASAGRLAATIAHEINNPLEAVMNLMYLVSHSEGLGPETRAHLEMADLQLKRVAHITKQTLGFYRESSQPTLFRPAAVLDEVLELMGPKILRKQVGLRREYADDEVLGSPGEARQIFSNLLSNAVDAVGSGGTISVRVAHGRDWSDHARRGARVTIADDGEGIAPDHRARIFEPFFTTKSQAGTGLGLWVAQQLAERQGGWLRVRSSTAGARRGSTFICFLPDRQTGRVAT